MESRPSRDPLSVDTGGPPWAQPRGGEGGRHDCAALCAQVPVNSLASACLPSLCSAPVPAGEHLPLFPQPYFFSKALLISTLPHFSSYHNLLFLYTHAHIFVCFPYHLPLPPDCHPHEDRSQLSSPPNSQKLAQGLAHSKSVPICVE